MARLRLALVLYLTAAAAGRLPLPGCTAVGHTVSLQCSVARRNRIPTTAFAKSSTLIYSYLPLSTFLYLMLPFGRSRGSGELNVSQCYASAGRHSVATIDYTQTISRRITISCYNSLMLHIANGDSVAGALIHSTVPGEKMAFREDLTSGPTPAGLSTTEWIRLRADFLTRAYEPAERDCLQELTNQQASLESHARHQETVLWFAHDFNCQIHLIGLLSLLAAFRSRQNRLSLICIGEFPGVDPFICLGQLEPQKLESLFDSRHEVTDAESDLARKAWSAYCSADPSDVQALAASVTGDLPFLADALRLHLARFPSKRNGLGLIENWALERLSAGEQKFAPLFMRFLAEYPLYGLGDSQFWRALKRMSDCAQPLIRITGVPAGANLESIGWGPVKIEITPLGRHVLEGREDFLELNGIDLWLGGVHLQTGKNEWRLDGETGEIDHKGA